MTLPTQTQQQFVDGMTTTFAGQTGVPPVFSVGDPLLALFETLSIQLDFLQALIVVVVNLTRAQTSTGADLDSWMAQFAFTRLPADYAEGEVTLSAGAPAPSDVSVAAAALVNGVYLGGALIQTSNGGIQYQIIPDTNEPTYDTATNTYILPAGQTTMTATAQAVLSGSSSNVAAAALVQFATSQPGLASVTNVDPIDNGKDAEPDADYRARFILYLASLAQATRSAILSAASSVQQGLQFSTVENEDPNGTPVPGSFTVFVDDGTGDPPSGLITAVYDAIFPVRAFGVRPFVAGPNVTIATIVITIRVASGYIAGDVETAVKSAIVVSVNALTDAATCFVSSIELAALSVAGCVAVQPGTTINGVNADLVPSSNHEVRTSVGSITVGTY